MAAEEMHPAVEQVFTAFDDRDAEGVVEPFADGGRFTDPAKEGLTPAEYGEYCAELFEAFPDVEWEPEQVLSRPDGTTAVEWRFRGTHEGEIEGVPPTGRSFDLPGTSIVTVEDGAIVRWRDYWDQRTFFEQVGLTFPAVLLQVPKLVWWKIRQQL